MIYYLDTSALVKRYLTETGSSWVIAICDPAVGHTIVTARITQAEAASAFARKYRFGHLSLPDSRRVLQDLNHDFAHQYTLVEIDQPLVDRAVDLTQRYPLRAYDSIQLASALTLNNRLSQAQLPSLAFAAADDALLVAARSEYLDTENPHLFPE